MKKDEILNMPAGREMDALIAEKVMGHKWGTAECDILIYSETTKKGQPCLFSPDGSPVLEHYSTDIAAAWLVKEKMCGYMLDDSGIYFRFVENLGARANDIIFHLNPPAICRAALLAVMERDE
jgi:hypothetical protein